MCYTCELGYKQSLGSIIRSHYACFNCHYSKKGLWLWHSLPLICEKCKNQMVHLGPRTNAPKHRNKKDWHKLENRIKKL